MKGPQLLAASAGRIKTRAGGFFPGVRAVFRGHDLHADLKDMDWLELYVFGITGKRYSPAQVKLMHAIWTYTSYPDTRIWNNREAGLSGTARSTGTLGLSAALAVSEASIYGTGILTRANDFFIRTRARLDRGDDLTTCIREELDTSRLIPGYGRPLSSIDERIPPIMELVRELGFDQLPYIRLAWSVEEYLVSKRLRMRLNYGGLSAALAADLGMSQQEYSLFLFPCFLAGMTPCYAEAAQKPEGTLYPFSCNDVLYQGPPKRPWPTR